MSPRETSGSEVAKPPREISSAGRLVARIFVCTILVNALGCRDTAGQSDSGKGDDRNVKAPAPAKNLILISIDTLRADRLGSYGYAQPTSPTMDALAQQGVRFARTVAQASWTLPSHMTIFTGMHPTSHGVITATNVLGSDQMTLPLLLQERGFRTAAFTGGRFVAGRYGFARGFETYDDNALTLRSAVAKGRAFVEQLAPHERYFLFLHTYDVHCPYDPPEEFAKMFRTQPPENRIATANRCGNPHFNSMSLTKGQVRFLSDQYDAGIRAADHDLIALIEFLNARGAWQNTVVVLLSDHGEAFKEHGQIGHARTLFRESLMVPFIIRAPGMKPRVVEQQVGLIDVFPTILQLLGIESTPSQGVSLVPFMIESRKPMASRRMFSELDRHTQLRSVIDGAFHFIERPGTSEAWLFDTHNDPTEQTNLIPGQRATAVRLRMALVEHQDSLPRPLNPVSQEISTEELDRLRSLGYIGGKPDEKESRDGS